MLMSAAFLASALVQFALGLLMAAMLGPSEFGLYAIAFAASVIAQTLMFEWIRLSITRFQGSDGTVRSQLQRALFGLMALALLVAAVAFFAGGDRRNLFALVIAASALWGLSECQAAVLRARFAQKSYLGLLVFRALASMVLMPLAAWFWARADLVLLAQMSAILLALLLHRLAFKDAGDIASAGSTQPFSLYLGYAMPIVATNLAYLLLFFGLRLFIASRLGLSEAGSFSLALDLGLKLVMTIGSALDLYLFQLAVRDDRDKGVESGRARLALNFGIVLCVLAPTLVGLWLVLPSLEALLVSPAYHASFSLYVVTLLPGLFFFGVVQYAIHPAHQLANRTRPLILAGTTALVLAFSMLAISSFWQSFSVLIPGIALLAGLVIAAILLWRQTEDLPPVDFRHLLPRLLVALGGMVALVLPIRIGLDPGLAALLASGIVGGLTYLAIAWLTNLAGAKDMIASRTKNGA